MTDNAPDYKDNLVFEPKEFDRIRVLNEKLQIAIDTLSFYANEENYSHYDNKNNIICDENCGDTARDALVKIKEYKNDF